ncbi:MAG: DUF151 domain-containing protein [Crenarchaeota archaeon]|nr:DUF151 domain-containing protein [Thermoproteota archaeon]
MGGGKTSQEKCIKVINVAILFPITRTYAHLLLPPELKEQLRRPVIELRLEDGRALRLMGIPMEIATEVWLMVSGKPPKPAKDFRLSMSDLVCELAKICKVVISDVIPELGVYVAEVEIRNISESPEGKRTLKMVPSHAILLALKCEADIYVSEKLLGLGTKGEKEQSTSEETSDKDITYW